MTIGEIKLKSDKEQIFEHFSDGAQPPPHSIFQGWLEPPRSRHLCCQGKHRYVMAKNRHVFKKSF